MKFTEAIQNLEEGLHVRRERWPDYAYLFTQVWQNEVVISVKKSSYSEAYSFSYDDIKAVDWMICK